MSIKERKPFNIEKFTTYYIVATTVIILIMGILGIFTDLLERSQ